MNLGIATTISIYQELYATTRALLRGCNAVHAVTALRHVIYALRVLAGPLQRRRLKVLLKSLSSAREFELVLWAGLRALHASPETPLSLAESRVRVPDFPGEQDWSMPTPPQRYKPRKMEDRPLVSEIFTKGESGSYDHALEVLAQTRGKSAAQLEEM